MIRAGRLRDWLLLMAANLIWASQFAMVKLVQEQMGPLFAVTFPMASPRFLLIPIVRRSRRARHRYLAIRPARRPRTSGRAAVHYLGCASVARLQRRSPFAGPACFHCGHGILLLGETMTPIRWIRFAAASPEYSPARASTGRIST